MEEEETFHFFPRNSGYLKNKWKPANCYDWCLYIFCTGNYLHLSLQFQNLFFSVTSLQHQE